MNHRPRERIGILMKSVFIVSIQSLRVNKRNTCVIFLVMMLSMAFLMIMCASCLAVIDFEEAALFEFLSWYFPLKIETLHDTVHDHPGYLKTIRLCVLFICIAVWIVWVSIRNVLTLNDGAKAKILSVLTTLGAKKRQRLVFLVSDDLILTLISIPVGFLLGTGISMLLLQYLNRAVCTRFGIPGILFLQGKPLFYCSLMTAFSLFTVLIASFRPALRLFKTPPVEIAKTKDGISVVLRETLRDRIINRCFGICGRLASANYENYKRRYRMFTRIVSLSTSFFILMMLLFACLMSLKSNIDFLTKENYLRFLLFTALAAMVPLLPGACGILYVQFRKRKPEFALLLSVGIKQTQLCGMVAVEMLYYVFRFLYQLMLTTLLGDLLLYIFIGRSEMAFVFPWKQILAVGCGVLLFLLVISLCMIRMVRHINIIDELKKSD